MSPLRSRSSRSCFWLGALCVTVIAAACAEGSEHDDDDSGSGGASSQTGTSSGTTTGTGTPTGTNSGTTAGTSAGTATATSGGQGTGTPTGTAGTGGTGAGGSGMDPLLGLPNPTGASCSPPGYGYCAGIEICRISGPNSGTCESCTTCGNLHAYCTQSSECDILFQCYSNTCVAICDFTTPQTCGVPNCLDVGHATHGVCWPP